MRCQCVRPTIPRSLLCVDGRDADQVSAAVLNVNWRQASFAETVLVACGWRPGKNFLTFFSIGRVRSRVRPVDAAGVAAGPNALRGSGPKQLSRRVGRSHGAHEHPPDQTRGHTELRQLRGSLLGRSTVALFLLG